MACYASAEEYSSNEDLVKECISGNVEVVSVLLESGACPNSEFDGWSPLAAASLMGHNDIVKLLLEHKAKVNVRCTYGAVALVVACLNGNKEFIEEEVIGCSKWKTIFADVEINCTGQMEIVSILINHGADVNIQDDKGNSALLVASLTGNTEAVQILLNNKANVNIQNNSGNTALLLTRNIEIVKNLVNFGANVNMQNNSGFSALMNASAMGDADMVKFLLVNDAEPNVQSKEGHCALTIAVCNETGEIEIPSLLLDHGAHVNTQDNDGISALMNASATANADLVKLLLKYGADPNALTKNGQCALMIAAMNETSGTEVTSILLGHGAHVDTQNHHGESALFQACAMGHTETVQLLINHGADVNAKNVLGMPALSVASMCGHVEIVQLLLQHGASQGASEDLFSPLNCARMAGMLSQIMPLIPTKGQSLKELLCNDETVSSLIGVTLPKNEMDAAFEDLKTNFKEHVTNYEKYASSSELTSTEFSEMRSKLLQNSSKNSNEITSLLLNHDNLEETQPHSTVFTAACYSGHIDIVKQCLEHGAKMNKTDAYTALIGAIIKGNSEIVYLLLTQCEMPENLMGENGVTALMISSDRGQKDIVTILLDHGVQVNLQDIDGASALLVASDKGFIEIVQVLLEYGAQVNMQEKNGVSALMAASAHGFTKLAEILIDHGAQVDMQNVLGHSALLVACMNGHTETVRLLLKRGAQVNSDSLFSSPLIYAGLAGTENVKPLCSAGLRLFKSGSFLNTFDKAGFEKEVGVLQTVKDTGLTEEATNENIEAIQPIDNKEIIELLLEHGADMKQGLMMASMTGQPDIAKMLLKKAKNHDSIGSLNGPVDEILHSFEMACITGNTEVAKEVLNHSHEALNAVKENETFLLVAIVSLHRDALKWLIEENVPESIENIHHETIQTFISSIKFSRNVGMVKLLLSHGAEVNKLFLNGFSPLIVASAIGSTEAVQCLLDHGAKVNMQGAKGFSPLIVATCNGHSEMVKFLLDHHAEVNMPDKDGDSALIYAIYKLAGRINSFPFYKRTKTRTVEFEKVYIEIVKILLSCGAKDSKNKKGMSAQILACTYGMTDIVKLLIAHGSKIDHQAVDVAIKRKHVPVVDLLLSHDLDAVLKCIESCPELQSDPLQEVINDTPSESSIEISPEIEQLKNKLYEVKASIKSPFKERMKEVVQILASTKEIPQLKPPLQAPDDVDHSKAAENFSMP